jgi:hypothetical protein
MNGFPTEGMDTADLVDGLINAARLAGETDAVSTDADPQTTINSAAADERVDAWRAALLAAVTPKDVSRTLGWNEPEAAHVRAMGQEAAEVSALQAADAELRRQFYADDATWQHEYCGPECDGSKH